MRPANSRFRSTHGVESHDGLDRYLLLAAFVIGTAGTVSLKMVEAPSLLIVLFPALVLAGYCASCWLVGRLALEPETIGDNCYYLGFLFTLASLAYTLYRLHGMGGLGAAEQAEFIPAAISGFGIALSSTIFGVFGRIFLMQFRPDLVVREREMRRDLAGAAGDLRRAASDVSRALKSAMVEMGQHQAELGGRLSANAEEHEKKTAELLSAQAERYAGQMEAFGKRLSKDIGSKVDAELDRTFSGLTKSLEKLESGIAHLSDAQERMTASHRRAADEVDDRFSRMSELVEGK